MGGLLTTVGPDHVGPPRGNATQHGMWTRTSTTDLKVKNEAEGIRVGGMLSFRALEIRVARRILISPSGERILVTDRAHNDGSRAIQVPLLYHANMGEDFLRGHGVVASPGDFSVHPRWVNGARGFPRGRNRLVTSAGEVKVSSSAHDLTVTVRWSTDTLPVLHQWRSDRLGALGIEPANTLLDGSDSIVSADPWVPPGSFQTSWISFEMTTRR